MNLEVDEEFLVRPWEVFGMDGEEFRDIELEVENGSDEETRELPQRLRWNITMWRICRLALGVLHALWEGSGQTSPTEGCGREEFGGGGLRLRVSGSAVCLDPGGQRYANEDAVLWFPEEVWPMSMGRRRDDKGYQEVGIFGGDFEV